MIIAVAVFIVTVFDSLLLNDIFLFSKVFWLYSKYMWDVSAIRSVVRGESRKKTEQINSENANFMIHDT